MKKIKAIIYARLSREDEDKIDGKSESRSIENQIKMLTDYAKEKGFDIYKILYDDGYSGGTMNRPGFIELKQEIDAKSFQVLLVKDFSRIGRVMYAVGDFVDNILPSKGIRLISVDDNYDSNNPKDSDELTAVFKYFINEYVLKDFKKKCSDARRHYAKTRHLNYYPKFGYNFDLDGKEIIDDYASSIVLQAFTLIDEYKYSCCKVAEMFNAENIPTRSYYATEVLGLKPLNKNPSRLWTAEKVWEIVKDYEYCGHSINWTRHAKEERILLKNTHLAIIGEELYWRVQSIIESHSRLKRRLDHIGKLLIDNDTGRHLLFANNKENNLYSFYFLRINNIQQYSIRAWQLEDMLYQDAVTFVERCRFDQEKFYEFYKRKLFNGKEYLVPKIEAEIEKTNIEYSKVIEKYFEGKLAEFVYQKELKKLRDKITELESRLSDANNIAAKLKVYDLKFKKFLHKLKTVPMDKLSLIRAVVSRVQICKVGANECNLTVVYKIEDFLR